ncbi:kinase-like domain-containing protein, partial [Paraphoma chrysanthemicola]
MSSQGYEEELLQRWFPATSQLNERTQFSETDIRGITDVLRTVEGGAWSRIPRIYIVLRLIGRLEAINSFVQHECSDTWFPFTQRNLPEGLRDPSERSGFLERQKLVCNTKALNLERADSRHGHFPDPSEIPLKKIGELGKGGSGFVDRVISTVSHREYALKLIKRGQTFRKDKQVLRNFEKELASLKRLSREHKHIIDLVGSYTDPKYVGILFPVADCDLTAFMVSPDIQDRRWSLRPYFGCLASALAFLHENNIRHKDIKPQNILIKDNVPYFTDFGLAVDWTDFGHSTTLGPTAMTPRYGAPEVAACEARNSSADIWSLGCVFLEMWAVLKGMSIVEVSTSTSVDGRLLPYHSKDVRLSEFFERITALPGPPSDLQPLTWIQNMLLRERHDRWSAHAILEHIRELGADDTIQYLFVGRCCLEDEDTTESVISDTSSH